MPTKKCCYCKQTLDTNLFSKDYKRKDGLQTQCKECHKKYIHKHYIDNKAIYCNNSKKYKKYLLEKLNKYKATLKCKYCGNNNPLCLDFHHTTNNKTDTVSRTIRERKSWDLTFQEIEKCDVVCGNCHKKLHKHELKQRYKCVSWYKEYKKLCKCELCGENDIRCLEFHHLRDKKYTIAKLVTEKICTVALLLEEIAKCKVLCTNCHRIEHHNINMAT